MDNKSYAILVTDEILDALISVAARVQSEIPQFYGPDKADDLRLGAYLASESMIMAVRAMKEMAVKNLGTSPNMS